MRVLRGLSRADWSDVFDSSFCHELDIARMARRSLRAIPRAVHGALLCHASASRSGCVNAMVRINDGRLPGPCRRCDFDLFSVLPGPIHRLTQALEAVLPICQARGIGTCSAAPTIRHSAWSDWRTRHTISRMRPQAWSIGADSLMRLRKYGIRIIESCPAFLRCATRAVRDGDPMWPGRCSSPTTMRSGREIPAALWDNL